MAITELAEGSAAEHAGELIALFGFPLIGLIVLILGLRRRSRSRRPGPPQSPMGPPPEPFPYSHPPQPGPHPGCPAYPGPPLPFPPAYPPGYPVSRPRASSGTALIAVGSTLLAWGLADFAVRAAKTISRVEHSAHVGQCMSQKDFQDNMVAPPPRDCSNPDSIFEVAARGDGSANCPDGKFQDSKYAVVREGGTTLCLILNFKLDQCYTASGTADNPSFAAADCDGSGPRAKVVVRNDSGDESQCPAGSRALAYPSPKRLYCLERLHN